MFSKDVAVVIHLTLDVSTKPLCRSVRAKLHGLRRLKERQRAAQFDGNDDSRHNRPQ